MLIVETLAPLILLIILGAVLAHLRFLGQAFMADLNKLAFWIALPALLFTSASHASEPGDQTWVLLGVVLGSTLIITGIGWFVGVCMRMPESARGTLMQSAFRGNLAYIGIPVLSYSFSVTHGAGAGKAMATAVIVMVLTMAFYNVLAVIVLQLHQHSLKSLGWAKLARTIATNPLLLAGLIGLLFPLLDLRLPKFVHSALDALGAAAVPLALLCIGGALATVSLKGKRSWIFAAALLKVAILPLIVWLLCRSVGMDPTEMRIALILTACPTAAASFVMASQMGGDTALASGSIALSTIFSGISLAFALWLTV